MYNRTNKISMNFWTFFKIEKVRIDRKKECSVVRKEIQVKFSRSGYRNARVRSAYSLGQWYDTRSLHGTHFELPDCSCYFSLFTVQQVNILCSPRTLTRLRCFIAVLFWKSRNMSPTARVKCSGTKRRRSSVTARKTLLSSLFSSLLPRFSSLVAPSFVYSRFTLSLCFLPMSLVPFVFSYAPPHTTHPLNPFRYILNWRNELTPG